MNFGGHAGTTINPGDGGEGVPSCRADDSYEVGNVASTSKALPTLGPPSHRGHN